MNNDVTATGTVEGALDSPWVALQRARWAELARDYRVRLDRATIEQLRSIHDPTDETDVREVYLPLAQLVELRRSNQGRLFAAQNSFLGLQDERTPFIVGVAGSVAVGKSTVAKLIRELLARGPRRPNVALVSTDGFLRSNAELQGMGILDRKGFPESYDRRALLRFVSDVKSALPDLSVPVYSQITYDIVPGQYTTMHCPDILVLEGLNVLQPAPVGSMGVSDFIDFSVYVDAAEDDIVHWFVERALTFRTTAEDPRSYFKLFKGLSDEEFRTMARQVWDTINGPNLRQNIAPTRPRATVILQKGPDHHIETVRIRRV